MGACRCFSLRRCGQLVVAIVSFGALTTLLLHFYVRHPWQYLTASLASALMVATPDISNNASPATVAKFDSAKLNDLSPVVVPSIPSSSTSISDICGKPLPLFKYPFSFKEKHLPEAFIESGIIDNPRIPSGVDIGFVNFLAKVAKGENVVVLVFGGSVTAGKRCKTPKGKMGKECAWPAILQNWLLSLGLNVRLENQAIPATTSKMFLNILGVLGRRFSPDMIIIDYLVNDAVDNYEVPGATSEKSKDSVALVYEKLLRGVTEIFPKAALVSFEAGCSKCGKFVSSHVKILDHYHILTIDYTKIMNVSSRDRKIYPLMWDTAGDVVHPQFASHCYMAHTVAFGLRQKLSKLCSQYTVDETILHEQPPYHSAHDLASIPFCKEPLTFIDAYSFNNEQKQKFVTHGFEFGEDPPGKPGWISRKAGSSMKVAIEFGGQPTFCITYLRSYVQMGNVSLSLSTSKCQQHELRGSWGLKASQLDVACFPAYRDRDPDRNYEWPRWLCGFRQKPNTSTTLLLKHTGENQQFKVVSVMSC